MSLLRLFASIKQSHETGFLSLEISSDSPKCLKGRKNGYVIECKINSYPGIFYLSEDWRDFQNSLKDAGVFLRLSDAREQAQRVTENKVSAIVRTIVDGKIIGQ